MEKLKTAYGRLLAKTRAEMAKPRQRIEALRNQAFMLYQLLSAWEKYIGMAKMTSAQAIGLRDIEGSHEAFAKLTGEEFENVNEGSEQGQVNSMENMQKQFEDEIKGEQEGDMNMEDYAKKLKDLMDGKGKKNEKDDLEETPVDPFFSMLSNAQVAQEEADRKFAEMVEKHGNTKNLQYGDGKIKEDRVIEAEEFLKDRVLESLIPAVLADDLIDFSKPKFEEMSIDEIRKSDVPHHMNPGKLQGLAIVEVFLRQIESLKSHPELSDPKDQEKLRDALYIVEKIQEFKIDEPKLLQMVVRKYGRISL